MVEQLDGPGRSMVSNKAAKNGMKCHNLRSVLRQEVEMDAVWECDHIARHFETRAALAL